MIIEVKTYYYDNGIPDDDTLLEALHIAKTNHCIVKLDYAGFGYPYTINIFDSDDLTSIQCRMPKYYGL